MLEKEIKNNPETRSETEILKECVDYYHEVRDSLIRSAQRCRDTAYSYRGFKVGCALLAYNPHLLEGEYDVYQTHNFTPSKKKRVGWEKSCAERTAALGAINKGVKMIGAIVTVSKEKDTGDGNRSKDVLHPCKDCRDMFRELMKKGILSEKSMICNVNDDLPPNSDRKYILEEMTVGELLEMYKDDDLND